MKKPKLQLLRNMTTRLITHIPGVTTRQIPQEGCERCVNLGGIRLRTGNLPLEEVLHVDNNVSIVVYTPSRNGGLLLQIEGVTQEAPSAYLIGFQGEWRFAAHDLNASAMSDLESRIDQSVIVIGRNRSREAPGVTLMMKEGACAIATRTDEDSKTTYVLRARNGTVESV